MGKQKCIPMWDDLLKGEDSEYFQDAIEATKEANCSPRPAPPVRRNSSDSSSCPSLYDTPEPRKRFNARLSFDSSSDSSCPSSDSSLDFICPSSDGSPNSSCSSTYDSPEPPQKKFIVGRDSNNPTHSFGTPQLRRDRSVIEIDSDSPSHPFDTSQRVRERSVIEIFSDSSEGS